MDTPISLLNLICAQNNTDAQYTLLSKEGLVHLPTFTYKVQVNGHTAEASGQSKKKAKHLAAKKMVLELMEDENILIRDRTTAINILHSVDESVDMMNDSNQQSTNLQQMASVDGGGQIQNAIGTSSSTTGNIDMANPIGKLQEICMKKHWHPPLYEEVESIGLPHEKLFKFKCAIENMNMVVCGQGKSKKSAKRDAAEKMLVLLHDGHLDKVDEILDRIPKKAELTTGQPEGTFNLRSEIIFFQQYKEQNGSHLLTQDLSNYLQDPNLRREVSSILNYTFPDRAKVVEEYFSKTDSIIPQIEPIMNEVAKAMQCDLNVTLHPINSETNKHQCWCELVCDKFNLPVLSAWGCHDQPAMARQVALSRFLIILLTFF